MTTYTITYNHTGPESAEGMAAAKAVVREQALRALESAAAHAAVVFVRTDDGVYAYTSQEAADADDTGAAAFATISEAE